MCNACSKAKEDEEEFGSFLESAGINPDSHPDFIDRYLRRLANCNDPKPIQVEDSRGKDSG